MRSEETGCPFCDGDVSPVVPPPTPIEHRPMALTYGPPPAELAPPVLASDADASDTPPVWPLLIPAGLAALGLLAWWLLT